MVQRIDDQILRLQVRIDQKWVVLISTLYR